MKFVTTSATRTSFSFSGGSRSARPGGNSILPRSSDSTPIRLPSRRNGEVTIFVIRLTNAVHRTLPTPNSGSSRLPVTGMSMSMRPSASLSSGTVPFLR
ncbi:hypothetical protein D3C83_80810 [compost metagenome]